MGQPKTFDQIYAETHVAGDLTIRPQDDDLHRNKFPKSDLWEESAFAVVGESGDDDIFLWVACYSLQGKGEGVWLVDEGAEDETEFIAIPKSQRRKGLTDHDFARLSWDPANRGKATDLTIEHSAEGVAWRIGDRRYLSAPPLWKVTGNHGGVDLDLTFRQVAPAFWEWGRFEQAGTRDRGGYDVLCRVDGTIKAGGKTYAVKDAVGIKERISVGASSNPIKTLPPPNEMFWLFGMKDEDAVFLFHPGTPGIDLGSVYTLGELIQVRPTDGSGEVSLTLLDRWYDPRSGLHLPSKWQLTMQSRKVAVDLCIEAHGRAWFNWVLKNGIRLNAYFLCTANGTLRRPDGAVVEFKDELLVNNWLRTCSKLEESL